MRFLKNTTYAALAAFAILSSSIPAQNTPVAAPTPRATRTPAATQTPRPTMTPEPVPTVVPKTKPTSDSKPATAKPEVNLGNLVVTAEKVGKFSTLVAALKAAGLTETLSGTEAYTVFAPTDEAFAALPKGTLESLLLPENKEKLAAILKLHVVKGTVMASQAIKVGSAKSLNGEDLKIVTSYGKTTVNGATITKTDVKASNGVIHVIDKVLLPK